jgi:hypothetical protein
MSGLRLQFDAALQSLGILEVGFGSRADHRTRCPAVEICVRSSPDSRHEGDRTGRLRLVP